MKHRRGFTFIETMITLALVIIIAIIATLNFFGAHNKAVLTNTTSQIVALLREAQSRSMSQASSSQWGVYFGNPTGTAPFYAMFYGTYSTSTIMGYYSLPPNFCYASISYGYSLKVTFNQISGALSSALLASGPGGGTTLTPPIIISLQPGSPANCPGALTSGWQTTTPLPTSTYLQPAVVNNGFVYPIGGGVGVGVATSTVYYAKFNSDGTIPASGQGTWTTTTPLPTAIYNQPAVVNNGYMYSIGGSPGGNGGTSTVYYAKSSSVDGPIPPSGQGTWTATAPLPAAIYHQPAVVNNGYVYSLGGYLNGFISSTVYYAKFNSDGTIPASGPGSWTATAPLPSATCCQPAVVNNGYVYSIGSTDTSTVYYAKFNSDGTIPASGQGTWTATTPLPAMIDDQPAVVNNGYVYSIGGYGSSVTSTVYYAKINSDGTLGSWLVASPLPAATELQPAVVNNGYVYSIGGAPSGNVAVSTVYYAQLSTATNDSGLISTITVSPQGGISY